MNTVAKNYIFRQLRVRKKIGISLHPRLSVYRSLKHIYAQIIDDAQGKTLVSACSKEKTVTGTSGIKAAEKVGELVAKKAVEKGISQVVFDRRGRPYHGRVKAVADGARQAGLKF